MVDEEVEEKEPQTKSADRRLAYAWFWVWLVAVTGVTAWIYSLAAGLLWRIALGLANLADLDGQFADKDSYEVAVIVLVGVLLWWRVVKTVVLQGSPFAFGMDVLAGRQEDGRRGRPATRIVIGDIDVYRNTYTGQFWYGAVFRAHPASDKLVRSRLELLLLALPFGFTLAIHESRVLLLRSGHRGRAEQFRRLSDHYAGKMENMPPDRFRKSLADGVAKIAKRISES